MARIRTIKPEAFTSESLAQVSVTAERTFFGLLTQADDQGRHRDHAAIIQGALWPLKAEHTAMNVEEDLQQLAEAGLICRYAIEGGKGYLHILSWRKHQKIDRPSGSRHPAGHEPTALLKQAAEMRELETADNLSDVLIWRIHRLGNLAVPAKAPHRQSTAEPPRPRRPRRWPPGRRHFQALVPHARAVADPQK